MLRLLWVLLLVFLVFKILPKGLRQDSPHTPGERAIAEPVQRNVESGRPWEAGNYKITPLAAYDIEGVVISTEFYWLGRESDLSPMDLAIGWGPMSDDTILEKVHFYQGGRFLRYSGPEAELPLSFSQINSHTANMHLIPATSELTPQLRALRRGQLVTLNGYLVRVDGSDGFRWVSSLSRTDRGAGACELMWVERLSAR